MYTHLRNQWYLLQFSVVTFVSVLPPTTQFDGLHQLNEFKMKIERCRLTQTKNQFSNKRYQTFLSFCARTDLDFVSRPIKKR